MFEYVRSIVNMQRIDISTLLIGIYYFQDGYEINKVCNLRSLIKYN